MEISVDFFSSLLQRQFRSRCPVPTECGVSSVIPSAFAAPHPLPYIYMDGPMSFVMALLIFLRVGVALVIGSDLGGFKSVFSGVTIHAEEYFPR